MRLTLRTLLAYLDDTLQPSEIKPIGQKVAESDAAQELIERIKQVTRRRRLTTPPATGPNGFDPNDVAEYLDGQLDSDKVAEVEKVCLESDVHLAEIASSHQILTLVAQHVGQPAPVPPTARERMYGLVQGKEADRTRKASRAKAPVAAHDGDDDLLGLPSLRRQPWMRWLLPVAGVLLLAALGLAVWQSRRPEKGARVANADKADAGVKDKPAEPGDKKKKDDKADDKGSKKDGPGPTKPKEPDEGDPKGNGVSVVKPVERPDGPSEKRVVVGSHVAGDLPALLVQRGPKDKKWRRVAPGAGVASADELVSLPGFASEVRTKSGVSVLLRGNVPEFSVHPYMLVLLESAAVLHDPGKYDLDLTLQRGRVYLRNAKAKGAATVRLRLDKEVWDLELEEPGTEVGVDLFRKYPPDANHRQDDEPQVLVDLLVIQGEARLRIGAYGTTQRLHAPPGPALVRWDSFGKKAVGPIEQKLVVPMWAKEPPKDNKVASAMTAALKDLATRLSGKDAGKDAAVGVALSESLEKDGGETRKLALYALGAIDAPEEVIELMGKQDQRLAQERGVAIFVLRRWLSRDSKRHRLLYDEAKKSGLLTEKYLPSEAATIVELLHDFGESERTSPETFEALANNLESTKVAIAELAYFHLLGLSGGKVPRFNAADSVEDREAVAKEVRNLIAKGKLPPPREAPAPPKKEP